jgi:hypothetical protein
VWLSLKSIAAIQPSYHRKSQKLDPETTVNAGFRILIPAKTQKVGGTNLKRWVAPIE